MILGPRTLMLNGKAHKVLSCLEDAEGVAVCVRPLDSPVVISLRLSHYEWHCQQQRQLKHQSPVLIIRK